MMQRSCRLFLATLLVFGVGGVSTQRAQAQEFTLGFDIAPEIEGLAGTVFQQEVTAELTSSGVEGSAGVQAWQIAVEVDDCDILSATTNGTTGALAINGGLRDSTGELDSFEKTEVIDPLKNGLRTGFVSAVILSFQSVGGAPITLPPSGTSDIAKFTIEGEFPIPTDGTCDPNLCKLAYVDGLIGSGEPIDTKVTVGGVNVEAARANVDVQLCAFKGDFAYGFEVEAGTTINGTTSIELPVETSTEFTAYANLTSGKTIAGEGAQGWQFGFVIEGDCDAIEISVDGMAGDFDINGGYRVPGSSFANTEIGSIFDEDGVRREAVSQAVVLDFNSVVTLPPTGTVRLARMVLGMSSLSSFPDGSCNASTCGLTYIDGLPTEEGTIDNLVTFQGANTGPSLLNRTIEVCPLQGEFTLSWEAEDIVEGPAGGFVEFTAYSTLTSVNLPTDNGAQGWQIAAEITGDWTLESASVSGTAGDFEINGGFAVAGNSFEQTVVADAAAGAPVLWTVTSVIVLDFNGVSTLPTGRTERLLSLDLTGPVDQPADGSCAPNPCTLTYVDGVGGINNVITYEAAGNQPAKRAKTVDICNFSGDFALGFDTPSRLETLAGSVFEFQTNATLSSSNLATDRGAQGWQIGIGVAGWGLTAATIQGTDAGDVAVPGNSFIDIQLLSELQVVDGVIIETGVVVGALLDFNSVATLPTNGTSSILNLTVVGEAPGAAPGGVCEPTICSLSYIDGLVASGIAVQNLITYEGANVRPTLENVGTEICPFSGDFTLGFATPGNVEGIAGGTVEFDVTATLTSSNLPTGDRGAQGWEVVVLVEGDTCSVTDATTAGTAGGLTITGGLRVVGNSFEQTTVGPIRSFRPFGSRIESNVLLDFESVVTLPSDGTQDILKITVESSVNSLTSMDCDPNVCTFAYETGSNLITLEGASVLPALSVRSVNVCPFNPEFVLDFDAPGGVVGDAGGTAEFHALATISSSGIEGDDGAQGWQLAIGSADCTITGATTAGTDAGNTLVPGNSFEETALVDGGVTSVAVVDFNSMVSLAPNTTSSALDLTVQASVPEPVDFGCSPGFCSLSFQDGVGDLENRVTFRGGNIFPTLGDAVIEICPELPAKATFSVAIAGGTSEDKEGSRANWTLTVPSAGNVDVEAQVVITAAVEPCASDPAACNGGENFLQDGVYGCGDTIDNDADGLIDSEDPDCLGIQGWSFSLVTGSCFNVSSTSLQDTVSDLTINGGLRDSQSFERTDIVDPSVNDGREGVTMALVLSLVNPIILPQVGDSLVLRVGGSIDASGLSAGGMTELCDLDIVPPSEPGLIGAGLAVKTAVTVGGQTEDPAICSASVKVAIGDVVDQAFARCDANDDGTSNIADAIWIVNELFDNGPATACQKAADCNDDGLTDISDATYSIAYRFLEGDAPPAPFPGCGSDPTADDLSCDQTPAACAAP